MASRPFWAAVVKRWPARVGKRPDPEMRSGAGVHFVVRQFTASGWLILDSVDTQAIYLSAMVAESRALVRTPHMADLVALMKPRIVVLALITAAAAMALAPGEVALGSLVVALVGTGLCVGAANALNMYLERDVDCLMART